MKSSATMAQAVGANSEGFHTTVLPAATMWESAIEEISVGKLYGVMAPTTPSGRWVSTSRLLFVCSCVDGNDRPSVTEHLLARLVPRGSRVLVHLFATGGDRLGDLLDEHPGDGLRPLDEQRVDAAQHLDPLDEWIWRG